MISYKTSKASSLHIIGRLFHLSLKSNKVESFICVSSLRILETSYFILISLYAECSKIIFGVVSILLMSSLTIRNKSKVIELLHFFDFCKFIAHAY